MSPKAKNWEDASPHPPPRIDPLAKVFEYPPASGQFMIIRCSCSYYTWQDFILDNDVNVRMEYVLTLIMVKLETKLSSTKLHK